MVNFIRSFLILSVLFETLGPGICFGYTWPVETSSILTSAFGPRCYNGYDWHAGWDMHNPEGDGRSYCYIYAVHSGVVSVGQVSGYQWSVTVSAPGVGTTGYHHFQDASWIQVSNGEFVQEGAIVGINVHGEYNHLHFNYWADTPVSPGYDDNTSHPARLLGDAGGVGIQVYSTGTLAAVVVHHQGDLVKCGVGLAETEYGWPIWSYVYDYEANVRSDMVADVRGVEFGSCIVGLSSEPRIAVEPTNFPDSNFGTDTYFTFPWEFPGWIVDGQDYTFAETGGGTIVGIDHPVNVLFTFTAISLSGECVLMQWELGDEFYDVSRMKIEKEVAGEFVDTGIRIERSAQGFQALDCPIGSVRSYRYRIIILLEEGRTVSRDLFLYSAGFGAPDRIVSISPNPTQLGSQVQFSVSAERQYRLAVFDLRGRLISEIASGMGTGEGMQAEFGMDGDYAQKLPSGCYFARLFIEGRLVDTRKITILR